MGLYVEVADKDQWFIDNILRSGDEDNPRLVAGQCEVDIVDLVASVQPDELICCLVDNGVFYALAVGFSNSEIEAFNQASDFRQKYFGIFKRNTLKEVCPAWDIYMEKDDE